MLLIYEGILTAPLIVHHLSELTFPKQRFLSKTVTTFRYLTNRTLLFLLLLKLTFHALLLLLALGKKDQNNTHSL